MTSQSHLLNVVILVFIPWEGWWWSEPCGTELEEYRERDEPDKKLESFEKSFTIEEEGLKPWNIHNIYYQHYISKFLWVTTRILKYNCHSITEDGNTLLALHDDHYNLKNIHTFQTCWTSSIYFAFSFYCLLLQLLGLVKWQVLLKCWENASHTTLCSTLTLNTTI